MKWPQAFVYDAIRRCCNYIHNVRKISLFLLVGGIHLNRSVGEIFFRSLEHPALGSFPPCQLNDYSIVKWRVPHRECLVRMDYIFVSSLFVTFIAIIAYPILNLKSYAFKIHYLGYVSILGFLPIWSLMKYFASRNKAACRDMEICHQENDGHGRELLANTVKGIFQIKFHTSGR